MALGVHIKLNNPIFIVAYVVIFHVKRHHQQGHLCILSRIQWFLTSIWESEPNGRHYLNPNGDINIIQRHMQRIQHIRASKLHGGK